MVRTYIKKADREAALKRQQDNVTFLKASNSYKRKLMAEGKYTKDTELRIRMIDTRWGSYRIKDITNELVQQWATLAFGGLSANSINRNLGVMTTIMNHAINEGMISEKPRIKLRRVRDARTSHLELDEIAPVVEYVRVHGNALMGFIILLLIDTGMRLGEARRLQWRDIKEDWITVRESNYAHSKTKMRMIPTSPRLLTYMMTYGITPMSNHTPQTSVINSRWSENTSTVSLKLNRVLREACVALGCGCGEDIRVHDMRHTFAFMCASAGADLGDIRDLMGHSNMNITMRYRGFVKTRAAAIIRKATEDAGIQNNMWKENPARKEQGDNEGQQ